MRRIPRPGIRSRLLRAGASEHAKVSPPVRQMDPEALSIFKDADMLEFLDLPRDDYSHAPKTIHFCQVLRRTT